jgi:hypothetical protein
MGCETENVNRFIEAVVWTKKGIALRVCPSKKRRNRELVD